MRYTLSRAVVFRGTGLHSGQPVVARVAPAAAGAGIAFCRTDVAVGTGWIPARYDLVSDTRLCTKLTNGDGVSVGTVEHLMAALAGCGIADATVTLDGPEVPIMDGSARTFVDRFMAVGLSTQRTPRRAIRILETVGVAKDGKHAALSPSDDFEVRFSIDFPDDAIGHQAVSLLMTGAAFVEEVADCRTFGRLAEVEQLRSVGLARGGSLENAIVIDGGRVLNVGGLRRRDEFVRHKALDAVGDLYLAGAPIIGTYSADRAGHEITNLLLHALFAQPEKWCWDLTPADAMGVGMPVPVMAPMRRPRAVAV
ncbi:MAG: UDP-3-O-acyl-N-acetylglucosamine deacetylase [Pseudomonadota bacterium]